MIWKHKEIRKSINLEEPYLLTLNEGDTPIDRINLGNLKLIVKREDKNPTGSWKDRGTAYKITEMKAKRVKNGVLSSSGNAAISFLEYSRLYPQLKLSILVSKNINQEKLSIIKKLIEGTKHELLITDQPRKLSVEVSAKQKIPNLRASFDDEIVKGYWSLGFEIFSLVKNQNNMKSVAIFVPSSSGTALVGLVNGLFIKVEEEYKMPRIFVCQTEKVHPFVEENNNETEESSLADAIIDSIGTRKPQISKIMNITNGKAYAISNLELVNAKKFIESKRINGLSYTSLLSIAGFLRAQEEGEKFKEVICIASGR